MYKYQEWIKTELRIEMQETAARLNTIYEQIKNYPTPIAGCDEQFNFLLAERDRLREMIEQLVRLP